MLLPFTVILPFIICYILYRLRKWFDGGVCTSYARLDGKTAIITGANTGIGKETAIDLAKRGAKVIIACRNREKSAKALEEIKIKAQSDLVFYKWLDLSSLRSVREFAASVNGSEERLDILINNAGVMMCPKSLTEDGHEMQLGVNHLGHFLLTNLLLGLINRSPQSRIITVSSSAHRHGKIKFDDLQSQKKYSPIGAYCQSKLANILFVRELHRRLKGSGVSVFAVNPGPVHTELDRHTLLPIFFFPIRFLVFKSPWQGAQTSVYCAVQKGIEPLSGSYFSDCKVRATTKAASNEETSLKLWAISEQLVGL